MDKYEHLVALGREYEPLDDTLKVDEYALSGCQSQVWIVTELVDGVMYFRADSDSVIIRGVLALLSQVLNGRPPADIVATDLHFIRDIGLTSHLSPSRSNGVATIIKHLHQSAAAFENS